MRSALILAGHGSHISPNTAGLAWRHVDYLRSCGVADEVTAAFWKEKPSFARVLDTLTAGDVTIIPLFTARGFFTQTVIPAEMKLTGEETRLGGRVIRYAPPLHEHPYLATVVRARIESAWLEFGLSANETEVAIIGHSTRRNPESRRATEAQVARLRADGISAHAVYLEDTPRIYEIYDLTKAPHLIAVPYFLAAGSHTTNDIPRALGLDPGVREGIVRGRRLIYTSPVGVDDDLREVILTLAREAGMPISALAATVNDAGEWQGFPAAGRDELIAAVESARELRFGALRLKPDEVRVWGDDDTRDDIDRPAELRRLVREDPFRSLATADDLPRGWRVRLRRPEWLHAVVETIYPGAVADWAAAGRGYLRIDSLPATARRQVGMFRPLETLPLDGQGRIVAKVCAGCVESPFWFGAGRPDRLPCPEPCNHWLSAALEAKE